MKVKVKASVRVRESAGASEHLRESTCEGRSTEAEEQVCMLRYKPQIKLITTQERCLTPSNNANCPSIHIGYISDRKPALFHP
eukprot:1773119-Pleurochrysis_carterae.AAC.1